MIKKSKFKSIKDFADIDFKKTIYTKKYFVTPNINLIAREVTTKSQMSLLIERLSKIGFQKSLLLIKNNLPFVRNIIKKDFATGIKLLCELEILFVEKLSLYQRADSYLLHNQITDSAVAFKNKNIIKYFFTLSDRYKFSPGLITYNIGPLILFLSSFEELPPNLIICTPIGKDDFQMNPSYEDIYEYLNKSHLTFINIKNE